MPLPKNPVWLRIVDESGEDYLYPKKIVSSDRPALGVKRAVLARLGAAATRPVNTGARFHGAHNSPSRREAVRRRKSDESQLETKPHDIK